MEALIIHPKAKEQATALVLLLKEMKAPFEKAKKASYKEEWVETMRK